MTATVKEFCRINGIDEKSENLTELLYSALTGGDTDRRVIRSDDPRQEGETAIPNGTP